MKNRILVMTAIAGCYLMTSAAGFAQNATPASCQRQRVVQRGDG